LRNIYHEHYLICGVYLNININDKIIDIDAIDNEKVCYTFKEQIPISQETITQYNDIAYYLQQANANEEAIFLLEKIIEKYPNRIVAYLNLADSYIGINNKEEAKENYEKYVKLMKQNNKDEKIPKRVLEFLENE
ncbi:tetratricopeptide repeat protein, partial [Aliarcobacter skirrowii]